MNPDKGIPSRYLHNATATVLYMLHKYNNGLQVQTQSAPFVNVTTPNTTNRERDDGAVGEMERVIWFGWTTARGKHRVQARNW